MFLSSDEFIFACNKEHLVNPEFHKILKSAAPNSQIIEMEPHEKGPVYSALQAEKFIGDKNTPVIISYCDFIMAWNYNRFLMKAEQYEGAMPVFRGFHPASFGDTYYAYLRANNKLEMLELREKKSFTDNRVEEYASTGVYYFDSWKTFAHYGNLILNTGQTVGSEYYCSLLYNPIVKDNKKVSLFEVDKFICWGTPEDLEEYMFWGDYFLNDSAGIMARTFKDD